METPPQQMAITQRKFLKQNFTLPEVVASTFSSFIPSFHPSSPAETSFLRKIIRRGLVENKNDLIIQRSDPNSPLYSVKKFEDLRL